jgi:large subunit ribosomal protein L17
LGRVTEHRIAMLRNQASALIQHERIQTTVPKAKELRPFVERLISVAKRSLTGTATATSGINARRLVARDIVDKDIVSKLFDTIAPRYTERPGGYTRLLRLGHRRGDSADMAEVELLGSEYSPEAEAAKTKKDGGDKPKKKGVGERLRDAIGGRRKAAGDGAPKAKAEKRAKGGGKVNTPRKAGGGG